MTRTGRLSPSWRFGSSLAVTLVLAGGASAGLCVWRSPDADIAAVFGSGTYKTVFEDVTDARQLRIEQRLGAELDPDETQFKFFPVFRDDSLVGTVMTHVGKGQFGAIEVVVSLTETDEAVEVLDVRIQRDREKAKQALRSSEFLGQFVGMTPADAFVVGDDIETAAVGAERASQAVASAVRKLLVVYEEFHRPTGAEGER